jgi:hypothetical protein
MPAAQNADHQPPVTSFIPTMTPDSSSHIRSYSVHLLDDAGHLFGSGMIRQHFFIRS